MFNPFNQQPVQSQNQDDPMSMIMQKFGNAQNFQNQANNMLNQFNQQGIDPRQKVQELLNSGQMTQWQFNMFRGIANKITGMNM